MICFQEGSELYRNQNLIEQEQNTVKIMIQLFCGKHHNLKNGSCSECTELYEYTVKRLKECIYGESKTTCKDCKTHCYKPEMRAMIKQVMRYSGPRLLYTHPKLVIEHVCRSLLTALNNYISA